MTHGSNKSHGHKPPTPGHQHSGTTGHKLSMPAGFKPAAPADHKAPTKGSPMKQEPASAASGKPAAARILTYTKVFRWRLPAGETKAPASVELIGSFTGWEKIPMTRDSALDAWHVTVHQIPGNRTHHYMFLVDGKPTHDTHCDGLAVPSNAQEEQYQIMTARGPRVFMLFAQTK